MQQTLDPLPRPTPYRTPRAVPAGPRLVSQPCVARVVGLDARGRVQVALPGAVAVATARLLRGVPRTELMEAGGVGREVLVVFDGGCPDRPIIVGLLESEAEEGHPEAEALAAPDVGPATARPQKVLIEALAELVLKCGAGSLTLRQDGKIILRGTHLLSRASGPIRIKGGHVEIN